MGKIFFLFCLIVISFPSQAKEITIRNIITYHDSNESGKTFIETMLGNQGLGLFAANTKLTVSNKEPLYCPPDNLAINQSQYFSIFRRLAEKNDYILDSKISFIPIVLMNALIKTFPCE